MPGISELERLYDEHAQALFGYLLNLTRNEADTRDLLQEIFIKIARHTELLRTAREERPLLIRLARNAAIDLMRRRGVRERTKEGFAEIVSPFATSADPDENLFREELSRALATLPEEQQTIAHLKLWGGLTFEQIAEALEIPPNTAASRYRYALDKMRAQLRPLYEELKKAER